MTTTQDIRDVVEAELRYDPLIDASDIGIRNINGDVALNGTVPSYPQYVEAAAAARRVGGVRNVHNHLEALDRSALIPDDSDVTVNAGQNTVMLSGHVRTWAEHDAVVDAAWRATGVYDVFDNLTVTG